MKAEQVIRELQENARAEIAAHSAVFFKTQPGGYGEGDQFYGIRVPVLRKIAKRFRNLDLDEVDVLLKHPIHEVRLTAVFILIEHFSKGDEKIRESIVQLYLSNLEGINNWDLVDSSCPYILGPYLMQKDRQILYDFSKSQSLWKRRIAIITCFHFIKNHDFTDALHICEILLQDHYDLIHKATGWMLREIGNRDKYAALQFLQQHYHAMPRTMLRYAIEKFDPEKRQRILRGDFSFLS